MGFSGMGPLELLVVLAIVVMLFGTKRLRNLGGDLGGALKGFRKAMKEGENDDGKKDDGAERVEHQPAATDTHDHGHT